MFSVGAAGDRHAGDDAEDSRPDARAVGDPLRSLVRHAVQLSRGNLKQRTGAGEMPGEFRTLADAMNHASDSLSRIASGAARTADEVAHSASDLYALERVQVAERLEDLIYALDVDNGMSAGAAGAAR